MLVYDIVDYVSIIDHVFHINTHMILSVMLVYDIVDYVSI